MQAPQFKDFAKEMVDYIANYLENIRDRRVLPEVQPGYLKPLIPSEAPEKPESWEAVMADIERVIMPGVTHWHSPKFHAYFPTANSYPAIVADMLSGAIACIGFTWIASPACTELEVEMLNWLGKMLGLPEEFLASSGGQAGGVIQGTASEATLVALLGAKAKAIKRTQEEHPEWDETYIISRWLDTHLGIETADSFNFNPHKWMLVNFDCSAMWLKEPYWIVNAFNVDPLYLKHDMQGSAPDYRHWQIPLGRRFRALKLWFVLRLYGVENIQAHIRRHCAFAKQFEALCVADSRFEIFSTVQMGLVCFRLKGNNEISEALLKKINGRGKIHMVPSKVNDVYFLRMAVCSRFTEASDIEYSWNEVSAAADELLAEKK
ncbi:AAEL010737-PA [Aedes aegypti]|uniref:Aromatic-L-amino-acid decarboxylase n=1 Tax=Aedes aegypti TaxID=7159 RepID=Q16S20_AEDAE|nr:AAEL010737-PA [Aedes aegypti]